MGDPDSIREAVRARAPFSTWVGVVFLFFLFGVIVLAVVGPAPRGDTFEQTRAKKRLETLKTQREADAKELETYGWIDKNKGVVRVPIDRAMQLSLSELARQTPAPAYPIAAASAPASAAAQAAPAGAAPPPAAGAAPPSPATAAPSPPAGAAPPSPTISPAPQPTGTPKPISITGPRSEAGAKPAAAVQPAGAPPGTQPGASAAPAASPQSAAAQPPAAASPTATPSPPGSPLPVRGKETPAPSS